MHTLPIASTKSAAMGKSASPVHPKGSHIASYSWAQNAMAWLGASLSKLENAQHYGYGPRSSSSLKCSSSLSTMAPEEPERLGSAILMHVQSILKHFPTFSM